MAAAMTVVKVMVQVRGGLSASQRTSPRSSTSGSFPAVASPGPSTSFYPRLSLASNMRLLPYQIHKSRRAMTPAKLSRHTESSSYSMEFMDPETGDYKTLEVPEENEPVDGASEEELLKRFAGVIGLDDQDVVGSLFNKMRNPASQTIVKQLEEGVGDVDDLLREIYSDYPGFRELYAKVESLIKKDDASSAHELLEGNYEALLEQLQEGIFGVDQIAMLDILAHLYLRLDDDDATEQLLEQARELLEVVPDTEKMVGDVMEHIGSLYLKLKKPKQALPFFMRSLSAKKATGEGTPSVVRTMIGLANAYSELGQARKSVELYKQILVYSEEALGSDNEDLAAPLMHLGSSLLEEGKIDEAQLTIERAMKLTEKNFGSNDGRYGVAACVFAQIKGTKGEFDKAVEWFERGLKVLEGSKEFSQDSHLDVVRIEFAALLSVLDREKESKEVLKGTKIKNREQYDYFSSQQVDYLEKVAQQYAEAGELEKSERALRRSLRLLVANLGPDSIQVSVVLQLLATVLHTQPDRQEEAEPLARESLRIREKTFGKDHMAVGEACSFLASILHNQDKDAEAAELMYRVVDIQEQKMASDDPQLEEALEILNMLLVNLGRHKEAESIIQRLKTMKAQSMSSMRM